MAAPRPCLDCHQPTTAGSRCPTHRQTRERARGTRQQRGYTAAWHAARDAAVDEHLAAVGPVCPGWRRGEHRVDPAELTGDHPVPLARGGSQVPDRIDVLCRPCNAAKGAR